MRKVDRDKVFKHMKKTNKHKHIQIKHIQLKIKHLRNRNETHKKSN